MNKYIGSDLTISDHVTTGTITATTFATDASAWTVVVGTGGTGKTAQVKTLVYYKNGYQVTITNGNASVVKLT